MTKQAAMELGQYNIAVNAIAPGAVNTPMYRSVDQMRFVKRAVSASVVKVVENSLLVIAKRR